MRRHLGRAVGYSAGAIAWGVMIATGCGSSSNSLGIPSNPLPQKDASTGVADSSVAIAPKTDAASRDATLADATPSDATLADAGSLYARLGGHSGIRADVNAIVANESTDPDIGTYFFNQAGAPANGHPTVDQIEECFTDYIGALKVVGGTETYPTTVTDDAGMWACRDMMTSHVALNISGGTFDHFMAVAGSTLLTLGVSTDDVSTLVAALELAKPQVVDPAEYDAGAAPYDNGSD